jgi:uncharacterized protein YdeI (YjbR/CyaY-like superfamily)
MPEADPARIRPFATPADFCDWLAENHAKETELWVLIFKKGSGVESLNWEQAVVEAIAWGWIDGIKKTYDSASYLQRFTPRRPRSNWSAKNCGHVERLIAEGRMQAPGLVHVNAAKADGRWDAAYVGQSKMEIPADFLAALDTAPAAARAKFDTLNRQNLFTIYIRLTTAKRPETRAKRMVDILAMLARGEAFY